MNRLLVLFDITKTHLFSRFKQTAVAALGVTFGIGTFIIMVSFMTGLNKMLDGLVLNRTPHIHLYNEIKPTEIQPIKLFQKLSEPGAPNGSSFNIIHSVKPKKSQLRIHNAQPIISHLRKDKRVMGVCPQTVTQVFYLAGSHQLNGMAIGIEPLEEDRLFNFGDYVLQGRPQDLLRNRTGILLGKGIAEKMSLSIGDRIQISTATGGIFPLKIVGLYQSGIADIDNAYSFVNLKMAQQLMGKKENFISDINIKLHDMNLAVPMAKRLGRQFNVTAIDVKSANAQFDAGNSIRNLITYSVSVTLLIVAGFGIYNILNMTIYEKMNDIAILKATGFSGGDVQLIFISQAIFIGLVGGLLGLLLGFGVSVLISHTPFNTPALPAIKTYPVNFDPLFYVIGITFAMISTFLAGYLPSRRAKRIDPVEIIRGQ